MKSVVNIIANATLFTIYMLMWGCAAIVFSVFALEGWIVDLGAVYGKAFAYIVKIIGVLSFFSFTYLGIIFKKKKINANMWSWAFVISIAFLFSFHFLSAFASDNIKFSTAAWEEYPQYRPSMFDNLRHMHNMVGFSEEEVVGLLSTPDERINDTYVYGDGRGNNVYVEFSEGIVVDYYLID